MYPFPNTDEGYKNMVDTIKNVNPNYTKLNFGDEYIDNDLADDISEFAANRAIEESNLKVNGEVMFVDNIDNLDRNWAKEYIEDGGLERFEKKMKVKSGFEESYNQATNDLGAGTVGWNFVAQTNPNYESFEDKEVQDYMIEQFGDDSFVVEVGDDEDPMKYSLDAVSEGALYPYINALNKEPQAKERGIIDEDGEFTPEFRADLSKHLKEHEGEVKDVFGKKLRKALDPYHGAEFLKNYNK